MSYGRGTAYGGGSCDSFISSCQLQMHRYIYDFVPSRKMKELILINHDQARLENNNPVTTENQTPSLGTVCTCESCDHDLARDCLKVRCICCKEYNHSMVLD